MTPSRVHLGTPTVHLRPSGMDVKTRTAVNDATNEVSDNNVNEAFKDALYEGITRALPLRRLLSLQPPLRGRLADRSAAS